MFKVENLRQNRTAFLKWNNCIRFILGLLYSLDIFDLFFVVGLVISIENHRFFSLMFRKISFDNHNRIT